MAKPGSKRVIDHHFPPVDDPEEELAMFEAAIEKMLSFDNFMAVALGHLIKHGYRPVRNGEGGFLVVAPESAARKGCRVPMKFTEALAAEAEAWFRADAIKALGPTKAEH